MCGIAGIVGKSISDKEIRIRKMTERMSHRGPNADGHFVTNEVALGHKRLSIIDLSPDANQPFFSADNRYCLVYNGEIYNYQDVKAQLSDYPFQTKCDTEVLLAAYITWGAECLEKFNGMFAFAIWDAQLDELFVARDRLGIKPFYYSLENGFSFSSEIKSLLASDLMPRTIRQESVSEFLTYQTVHAPFTILNEIRQLKAGHFAYYKNDAFEETCYWSPDTSVRHSDATLEQTQSAIKDLLYTSVERRMISDVPLGAFLSGGIDSTAIVGMMSQLSDQSINTFSVVFDDKKYDESNYSNLASKLFQTDHQQIRLNPNNLLDYLPNALAAMDSPSGDGINSYIVSAETKRHGLTVALSGLGGDELFAGYPVFDQYPKIKNSPIWALPLSIRKSIARVLKMALQKHKQDRMTEILSSKNSDLINLYPIFRKIHSKNHLNQILKNTEQEENQISELLRNFGSLNKLPHLSQLSVAEISSYTQNVLLRDADQMSMAHALEVRVPFFDHELVEYVLGVSDKFKSITSPKKLLTNSLDGLIPDEIIHRPKQGFAFPWENWMKNELNEFCYEQLSELENTGLFNMNPILSNWKKFNLGDTAIHWNQIWLLAVLNHWISSLDS